jgi:RNA polymerase sigma-70 factor, ECF subfamily
MTDRPPSHRPAEPACTEEPQADGVSRTAEEADALLRQLIMAHHAPLYRYAYRLTGQPADAEDLTQQAFLLAQQKLHQLRETDRAGAWLFAIVRSCFLKACRQRRPTAQLGEWDADELPAEAPEIDRVDQELLRMALAELPDEFRLVVLMFYFEDLSYKDIAEQLDLPIGTVMSRLSRAKGHLRRRLAEEQGGDSIRSRTSDPSPTTNRRAPDKPSKVSS